eukprot:TRINITY_DN3209_c0_g1_i1.p1 TRINITY_DN3209_c0_g1~~TRINITY_DN3209_c0_g1_i1.p1  ORF type:complete len:403 (-),score=60.35 TRINITY_DN3209_c0_g1_i1:106-1314(-)
MKSMQINFHQNQLKSTYLPNFRQHFKIGQLLTTNKQTPKLNFNQRRYVSEIESPLSKPVDQTDALAAEMMEKLQADQMHLFDDVGIDPNLYEDVVDFRDPVTKYDNIQGYIFNIKMLKNVFSPDYIMHDIRKTGENEITTRWTMEMPFFLGKIDPIKNFYQPKMQFTGTSVMGYNPLSKKFNKHWDFWDSLEDNKYLSVEGIQDIFSQLFNFSIKPDKKQMHEYVTYIRKKEFEIRKYSPFKMVSVSAEEGPFAPNTDLASIGKDALQIIQKYCEGENEDKIKLKMTFPIYLANQKKTNKNRLTMALASEAGKTLPVPLDDRLHVSEVPGNLLGVVQFNGIANNNIVEQKHSLLVKDLNSKGLKTSDDWVLFCRYNDASTNPLQRTNEVAVMIESGFDLWAF